jgi:hypothetical protein
VIALVAALVFRRLDLLRGPTMWEGGRAIVETVTAVRLVRWVATGTRAVLFRAEWRFARYRMVKFLPISREQGPSPVESIASLC